MKKYVIKKTLKLELGMTGKTKTKKEVEIRKIVDDFINFKSINNISKLNLDFYISVILNILIIILIQSRQNLVFIYFFIKFITFN